MKRFTFEKPDGFELKAAADFYSSFTPGSGMAVADAGTLTLAFLLDHSFEAVAVALNQFGDGITAEYAGTNDEQTVRLQVARMLGLDVDAGAWRKVGERDPVIGKLQADFPGFFTAAKPSPYDAAVWGVIAPRLNMNQAAKLKMGIAASHGEKVQLNGRRHAIFPAPSQVLKIEGVAGLSDEKLARLKGIATAALDGKLDVGRLRAMNERDALEALQQLRGVGPWTATHILYRGAAIVDGLPTNEPRVIHGMADAYKLQTASLKDLLELSEGWRPFRMWVCILLARHLGRVGGWNKAGLMDERSKAGRALVRRTRREEVGSAQ